jgi:hypothetical protein
MITRQTLYTFGYLDPKRQHIVKELKLLSIPLVDIRYSPSSKRYEWQQSYLKNLWGIQYFWIQDLGNENYRAALNGSYTEPQIKLHNPERGLVQLGQILQKFGHAAIFCACHSKQCHRFLVAEMAKEQLDCTIVHL